MALISQPASTIPASCRSSMWYSNLARRFSAIDNERLLQFDDCMKQVKKSVLLWYSPHEIYQLVTDVEKYSEFLPWCERGEIVSRDADGLTVRLHLAYSGLRRAFTTKNVHVADESVRMALVDGPFSLLDGLWRFVPLAAPGAPSTESSACKI